MQKEGSKDFGFSDLEPLISHHQAVNNRYHTVECSEMKDSSHLYFYVLDSSESRI
jgi:hypothetical protein